MLIKFKKKIVPAIGEKRIKKYFVPIYITDEGIVLFQNIYKKQIRCVPAYYEEDYNRERKKAIDGKLYEGSYIRKGWWSTVKIYLNKKDAFVEEI